MNPPTIGDQKSRASSSKPMSSRYFKITDHAEYPTRIVRSDDDGDLLERVNGQWKSNIASIIPDLEGDRLVTEIDEDQAEAYQS